MTETNDSAAALAAAIAGLSQDHSGLANILKVVAPKPACGVETVSIHAYYLPFLNSRPIVEEFVDAICEYLVSFALPRSEIADEMAAVAGKGDAEKIRVALRLRQRAVDTFIQAQKATQRTGECGELILYLLTEWVLSAPQILAKMGLKTNSQMPVYGADGVHVRCEPESNRLAMIWGEAKVHAQVGKAVDDAVTSITKALEYKSQTAEISLVRRYFSITGLSDAQKAELVSYLNPLGDNYSKRVDVSSCLICFDFAAFKSLSGDDVEDQFKGLLAVELDKASQRLAGEIKKQGIDKHRLEIFFLPMPAVAKLRELFQAKIGWTP